MIIHSRMHSTQICWEFSLRILVILIYIYILTANSIINQCTCLGTGGEHWRCGGCIVFWYCELCRSRLANFLAVLFSIFRSWTLRFSIMLLLFICWARCSIRSFAFSVSGFANASLESTLCVAMATVTSLSSLRSSSTLTRGSICSISNCICNFNKTIDGTIK